MRRISLLILPGIVAIALYVVISSLGSGDDSLETLESRELLDFNAYSEGINTILYDALGNINYTLQAQRQTSYKDNTSQLESPLIRLYEDGHSRWNIVANSGKISATQNTATQIIELTGNVEVFSIDESGNRMTMSTEFLTVNPELETLTTDDTVTVVTNNLQQSSTGMIARLKTDEIVFLRNIRGHYAQLAN